MTKIAYCRDMIVNDARFSAQEVHNNLKNNGEFICMMETTFKNKKTQDEFVAILLHRYKYKVTDCTGHGMLMMITNVSVDNYTTLVSMISGKTNSSVEIRVAPDLD
jgi:hypothetical protein